MNFSISKQCFNEVYLPQLNNYDSRFNVFYGGAGSGKSVFVVQKMILKYLKEPGRKCLVIRKVGNSIRESIFSLFKSILSEWSLYNSTDIKETNFTITLTNGSQFIFKGLDDPEKIKSIAGIDDIIVEECTELEKNDFDQLNLRLRSSKKYNQIHVMFNPVSKSNWVYSRWFEKGYNKDNTMVLHTTYKDNKFLSPEYIETLENMKEENPTYYRIYALGEFATLDKLIYTNWDVATFDYKEILKNKNVEGRFSLDFGYTNDPSAFICSLLNEAEKEIYVFDGFYEKGLTNEDIYNKIYDMGFSKEVVTADSAEPKSIEELYRLGLNRIRPSAKGRDSILNGITYLQKYKIIVHSKCDYVEEELKNYTWQKDKATGLYINKPIDKYNHALDSLRYGIVTKPVNKIKLLKRSLLF